MKKAFLIFTFFFCVLMVYSQTQYIDVVYLKNGGKISGIIVEQIPGESIKIETKDGGLLIFKMDEIEKMTKEKVTVEPESPPPTPVKETPPPPPPTKETPPPPPPQTPVVAEPPSAPSTTQQTETFAGKKFQHSGTQLTILGGFVSWKQTKRTIEVDGKESDLTKDAKGSKFVMTATATFQSDNIAFVFGGVVNSFSNGWMNPYYLGINYYLNLDQFSPYIYARAGFGIGKLEVSVLGKDKYDAKGFYANVGAGFKYYIDKTWGLNCEVGFAYQTASVDEEGEYNNHKYKFKEDEILSGVGLGVGFFIYL